MDTSTSALSVFARLTVLELRKLFDTRSARWVLIGLLVPALALLGVLVWVLEPDQAFDLDAAIAAQTGFLSLAAAIIGILGMAGDWQHRVTTSYLPLVRSRSALYLAKLTASLSMALLLLVAVLIIAGAFVGIVGVTGLHPVGLGNLRVALALSLVNVVFGTFFGLGVAALVRRVAFSLVLVAVLTIGLNVVAIVLPPAAQAVMSTSTPVTALLDGNDTTALWQVLASLAIWYIAPIMAGWRLAVVAEA